MFKIFTMKKINLIILIFPLVIFNCFSSKSDINYLLLLKSLEDSDATEVDTNKYFWTKINLVWKKAVAKQIKSIDYNNLPENLSPSQIQDALEMKELKYDCLQVGCSTKSDEQITDLTPVQYFTKLEVLNLKANSIKTIPSEIEKLTKIKSMNLSRNQIKKLSNFINQLSNLETLDLYGNQIRTISKNTFTKLDRLKFLNLIQGSFIGPTTFSMFSWDDSVKKEIRSQVTTQAVIRFGDESPTGTRTK